MSLPKDGTAAALHEGEGLLALALTARSIPRASAVCEFRHRNFRKLSNRATLPPISPTVSWALPPIIKGQSVRLFAGAPDSRAVGPRAIDLKIASVARVCFHAGRSAGKFSLGRQARPRARG
eukprot:5211726-Pyramimonas_sp.AAC.1